uniref:Uncharacterized protein n=1 Tax=Panagrolaimus sp. JU765 TaxID=591449 RepID=A0AC34QMT9_9BILA
MIQNVQKIAFATNKIRCFATIWKFHGLKIHLKNNGLQQISPFSFKNLNNVRELLIEDECVLFHPNSLSSISVLDFLVIKGACSLETETFSNTTRVHNLHISDSKFNLTTRAFSGLSHVNHIQIQNNQIDAIQEETFAGSSTIGNLQIQTNRIERLEPRALAGTENLGTVVFTQNVIYQPLSSPECILNDAQKFIFSDNTLFCGCPMKWILFETDRSFLKENFCGREEAFKALIYFEPQNCPTLPTKFTTVSTPEISEVASFQPTNAAHPVATYSLVSPIIIFAQVSLCSIVFQ